MVETSKTSYSSWDDRISRLPDELIHYILSFIDMKYAVQTSVLSKRWIHIWKSLPFLRFYRSSFSVENTKRFVDFVYMVFLLRNNTDIHKFKVDWEVSAFDDTVIMNVNRWSLNAVKYNVQEITIIIDQLHNSPYEIPHRLLNCESLRKLRIQVFNTPRYVDMILPRSMNLPRLEKLTIRGLSISNLELSDRLFTSCPVIETLSTLRSNVVTNNPRSLIIDSLSLKNFLYTCWHGRRFPQNDTTANVIKLCAPNLEDFFCCFFLAQDYSLEISSPLYRVRFEMRVHAKKEDEDAETYEELPPKEKGVYARRTMKFLRAVSMVTEMGLSSSFLEVLSQAPDLRNCQPIRLYNLQDLTLEMWSTRGCLRAIAYVLSISPNITRILLVSKQSNLMDVGDDWEAGLSTQGMLSHLKYVDIDEVDGCDAELKLLSFLLKHAMVLAKVALSFRSTCRLPYRERQVEQFKKKLRAVPTASSSIKLVFN